MTNEEAIAILIKMIPRTRRGDSKSTTHTKMIEAIGMAIKALRTPPNEDWEKYSDKLYNEAYTRGRLDGLEHAAETIKEQSRFLRAGSISNRND